MDDSSGERVAAHAKEADAHSPHPLKGPSRHDELVHLHPTRWWFTSSAFPMIAGTFGPIASAFSICALVRPWRQSYDPATTTIDNAAFIDDPVWLTTINAVQLVVALVANMALLLNMTRRLRFSVAQPVTIAGWCLSSLALVALLATAAGPLGLVSTPQATQVFSQAFYYGIYAAILYFICASLMSITMIGALAGKYAKDFELTYSQRTLMIQTIFFLVYLLGGAAIFSSLEEWAYLDALYWADCTLFTIGLGDFHPTTAAARGLLIPFALFGIISLGLVIGSIRSLMLERGKKRLDARIMEKSRRRLLKRMVAKGKDGILVPIREDKERRSSEGDAVNGITRDKGSSSQASATPSTTAGAASSKSTPTAAAATADTGLSELARREHEFKLMRRVQHEAARRRQWAALGMSTSTWLILWLVGARIFQSCEAEYQGWTYLEAVTFSFVSLTTIGYGDITPLSNGGKAFFVFWTLLALPTTTVLISHAGDTIIKGVKDGSNLILPGEKSWKEAWGRFSMQLSFGRLGARKEAGEHDQDQDEDNYDDGDDDDSEDEPREMPPGFLGESQPVNYHEKGGDTSKKGPGFKKREQMTGAGRAAAAQPEVETRQLRPRTPVVRPSSATTLPEIPTDKAEYRVRLIDELRNVAKDLRSSPPRRYSYSEWAYYLRLVGEDESSALTHERARMEPHRFPRGHATASAKTNQKEKSKENGKGRDVKGDGDGGDEKDERVGSVAKDDARCARDGRVGHAQNADAGDSFYHAWSWVGSRSPLLETREEAEWILAHLSRRLAEELRAERDGTETTARTSEAADGGRDRISETTREQDPEDGSLNTRRERGPGEERRNGP